MNIEDEWAQTKMAGTGGGAKLKLRQTRGAKYIGRRYCSIPRYWPSQPVKCSCNCANANSEGPCLVTGQERGLELHLRCRSNPIVADCMVTAEGGNVNSEPHKLDFIGDHLAIDFINTLRTPLGVTFESLQTDDDVRDWIRKAGVAVSSKTPSWAAGSLVRKARQLREIALKAVEAKKAGKRPSLEGLNSFLEHSSSHLQLAIRPGSRFEMRRVYSVRTVEQYLAPIAESVADLLANGDFDLIRHCEGDKCVLWFYDRTKAHRRRWCSPTGCGNRAKVGAFRARASKQEQAQRA